MSALTFCASFAAPSPRIAENRGAEGAEGGGVWGGGARVPLSNRVRGLGRGLCPLLRNFFLILDNEMVFFGAFWALYFTIQLPALRTESGYIHVGDRYI